MFDLHALIHLLSYWWEREWERMPCYTTWQKRKRLQMTCMCYVIGGTVVSVRCHAVKGGGFSENVDSELAGLDLHFQQVPRRGWCCHSRDHTLNVKGLRAPRETTMLWFLGFIQH